MSSYRALSFAVGEVRAAINAAEDAGRGDNKSVDAMARLAIEIDKHLPAAMHMDRLAKGGVR